MKMTWQEPPTAKAGTGGGRIKYTSEAEALMSHPGKWALLETQEPGRERSPLQIKATCINKARLAAFRPAGKFEAVVRKLDCGSFGLFVRYKGANT